MTAHLSTPTGFPPPPPGSVHWPWTTGSIQLPETMPNGLLWPRVIIVGLPYNQGQFIEETIRSVLLQGYPKLEQIVMDGGSTDDTVDILRKYKAFISYLRIGLEFEQTATIATGFDQSVGEVAACVPKDEEHRHSLSHQEGDKASRASRR